MSVRTFLIADIRGYSRFTEEYGDEAAGQLAVKFAAALGAGIESHGGTLIDARGDEGVAVFTSARQAIRAAVDLQARFAEETEADPDLPLRVGIGIDSGEAVQLEDGTYRGSALNVAARLCARASAGEVLVTAATSRLAGRLDGLHYADLGRARLKNIPDPTHVVRISAEGDERSTRRRTLDALGGPRSLRRRFVLAVALVGALATAGIVSVAVSHGAEPDGAMPRTSGAGGGGVLALDTRLAALVPAPLWRDCKVQTVPDPKAIQTAVCAPRQGLPDRWEISSYWNPGDLTAAYEAELRSHAGDVRRDSGRCNAFTWGGELQWLHGPGKPGGRVFCYFDGYDAVIVWTHERLSQPTHRDVLVIARERGSDHVGLTRWWRPWHHLIGKAQET